MKEEVTLNRKEQNCCGLIKRTPKEETSKIKERGCSNDRPTEEKIHSGV
jgi:hypothetical protein